MQANRPPAPPIPASPVSASVQPKASDNIKAPPPSVLAERQASVDAKAAAVWQAAAEASEAELQGQPAAEA